MATEGRRRGRVDGGDSDSAAGREEWATAAREEGSACGEYGTAAGGEGRRRAERRGAAARCGRRAANYG